jgi:transcriptional regulator with XRE-family HTH domain
MAVGDGIFHRNARMFRHLSGFTMDQVSTELRVSTSAVRSWERTDKGGKIPGGDKLIQLAAMYSRDPREFFVANGAEEPQRIGVIPRLAPDLSIALRRKIMRAVEEVNREHAAKRPPLMRSHPRPRP